MREGVSSVRVALIYGKFAIILQNRIVLWPRRVQPVVPGLFCHADGLEVLLSTARGAFVAAYYSASRSDLERITALNYPARREQFNPRSFFFYINIFFYSFSI